MLVGERKHEGETERYAGGRCAGISCVDHYGDTYHGGGWDGLCHRGWSREGEEKGGAQEDERVSKHHVLTAAYFCRPPCKLITFTATLHVF